jgi:serine protease Do
MHIKDQIAAHGKVEHARLGVEIQPLNPSLAASFDLNNPNGALVAKVEPDSAAAHAGLQSGDVILKYDGEPVHDAGDLSAKVGLASPGDTVKLDVWRNGKPITVKVQLGNATQVASAGGNTPGAGHGRLGLAVRPLTPDERQQIGVSVGLLVENASGPAADAGIQPGDVVLSVDGTPVRTAEQMRNIVRKHDKQVALLIQRGDARIFVPVVLG